MSSSRFAAVFGGGGSFGIGFNLGIVAGLRDQGLELAGSPMLGTSAGSWAAAATALGVSFDELAELSGRFPDPRPDALAKVARTVFGDARHPDVSAVACRVPDLSRRVLPGGEFPLADLLAASSAVPGLLSPHRVGRAVYVDGGVRSAVSADLASPADLLIVTAPMSGRVLGRHGGRVASRTRDEVAAWCAAHGGSAAVFEPGPELSELARWPHQLFDKDRAIAAFTLARTQARVTPLDGVGRQRRLRRLVLCA